MSEFSPLAGFAGAARLFPLPNVVFFPHAMQPLHIFEPRYRQMTADALAGDRLIALTLPRPGWEAEYEEAPTVYPVACLGKIVADQQLADGRYNILLRGLSRIHIVHEIPHGKLYRKAKVELLVEVPPPDDDAEGRLRRELAERIKCWLRHQHKVLEQFEELMRSDLPVGALCDIFSFALPLDMEVKQMLLEELEVEKRLELLAEHMKNTQVAAAAERKFPPEFSVN
jgi:Lon protease-like protein